MKSMDAANSQITFCEFWGFRVGKDSSRDVLLCLHLGEDGGTEFLRNVGILSQHYTASLNRKLHIWRLCT